jgi:hypothetical protein
VLASLNDSLFDGGGAARTQESELFGCVFRAALAMMTASG